MMEGVSEYQCMQQQKQRKRKRVHGAPQSRKKQKTEQGAQVGGTAAPGSTGTPVEAGEGGKNVEPPAMLSHVTVGVNEVTKSLETLVQTFREHLPKEPSDSISSPDVCARLVFVCKGDVDPPALISHFPNLVAACNSTRHNIAHAAITWLIPLAKGSESTLAAALGRRRASVVAVKVRYEFESLHILYLQCCP